MYISFLIIRKKAIGTIATYITVTGFVSQTVAILMRWNEFYHFTGMGIVRSIPVTNLYESLIFFVWCLILGYLVIEWRYKNRSFGAFITPIAGLALAFIEMSGMSKSIQPLVPALQSNWLLIHVILSFIAYALFTISFSTAIMYLIVTSERKKEFSYIFWVVTSGLIFVLLVSMGIDYFNFGFSKPETMFKNYLLRSTFLSDSYGIRLLSYILSISFILFLWRYGYLLKNIILTLGISKEILDEITYRSIAIGFPVFTLGGLIFGAIWADQAWGVYWSWDPKETWSLITWFIYAFYLHSRLLRGWRGKRIAVVAVAGFFGVVLTYLGVNLLLSGLHSYGALK